MTDTSVIAAAVSGLMMCCMGSQAAVGAPGKGTGTVQGMVTDASGAPLNGVCPILYDAKATKQIEMFAATGTSGTAGFYTQGNVPVGHYKLLFTNCGANTNGTPDPNYVWIFYGSVWDPKKAQSFAVGGDLLTNLGPQPVPLGGTVMGVVTDTTTGIGADTPPFAFIPPGGKAFVLASGIGIDCADPQGNYGAPGALANYTVLFAPANWGCPNSQGMFNFGFWKPVTSGMTGVASDGVATVNGALKETKLCCGMAREGVVRDRRSRAVAVRADRHF